MTEKSEDDKLNPTIREMQIGVRKLRMITIYPLSIADQKKMTESIADAVKYFFASEDSKAVSEDIALIDFIIKLILENLVEFIRVVTDYTRKRDAEGLLSDMTNDQAVDLAQMIFEQNYETALKNGKSLLNKIKSMFLLERPLPQSAQNTDIDLDTSIDALLETEDSPTGS
jgi:hypothetical protein